TVKMPHGHEPGWAPLEIALFTDAIFRRRAVVQGLATVGLPVVQENTVHAAYSAPSAVEKAQLHWTADVAKPWQEREWQTASARVVNLDEVEAALPAARPLVFFLTLTDVRGAIVSTPHVEVK